MILVNRQCNYCGTEYRDLNEPIIDLLSKRCDSCKHDELIRMVSDYSVMDSFTTRTGYCDWGN